MLIGSKKSSRRLGLWLLTGLAALGCMLLFYASLVGDSVPISGDMTLFYAPFFSIKWDEGIPLWNPYLACGMPMESNFQYAAAYPARVPFYFLSDWRDGLGPYLIFHFWIAILGTLGMLRGMGYGWTAAYVGAIIFACGGYMAGRPINTTIFIASCWVPWVVWGAIDLRPRGALALGIGTGAIWLTGSPHIMAYGLIGFGIAWAVRFFERHRSATGATKRTWARRLLFLGLGMVMGLVNILPGVLLLKETIRTETTAQNNFEDSLHWGEIPSVLLGGSGGDVQPEINDKILFIGTLAWMLIFAGAAYPATWKRMRWHLGLGLSFAGIVLALGKHVGWDHVMPHIWGMNMLEGPARALVLTAVGFSIMAAEGMHALPRLHVRSKVFATGMICIIAIGLTQFYGIWPDFRSFGQMAMVWLKAPEVLQRGAFSLTHTLVMGIMALGILWLPLNRSRKLSVLLPLLVALELSHFSPRVMPQTRPRESFDAPRHISELQVKWSHDPFRVTAFDPLRFQHTQMDSLHKFDYLMPNTATIYGLPDITGLEPLLPADYKALFRDMAGIPHYSDPIRHLDLGRPSEELFAKLGVRYLIGHPNDRQLTTLPIILNSQARSVRVDAGDDHPGSPISGYSFVSLIDGATALRSGQVIGWIEFVTETETVRYPIRYGIETAHIRDKVAVLNQLPININMRWRSLSLAAVDDNDGAVRNYRASIEFDKPLTPIAIRWVLEHPDLTLFVPAQAYRLAKPTDKWRQHNPGQSPEVFEFLGTKGLAEWAQEGESAAEILRWSPNQIQIKCESETGGRLLIRNRWNRNWQAELSDGSLIDVEKFEGMFIGLDLPAGKHIVTLQYRSRLFYGLLGLSVLGLALTLCAYVYERVTVNRAITSEDAPPREPDHRDA